jgi:hypothetical protein
VLAARDRPTLKNRLDTADGWRRGQIGLSLAPQVLLDR